MADYGSMFGDGELSAVCYSHQYKRWTGTVGFEPTTVGLEVRRSIRAELCALTGNKTGHHQKPCESGGFDGQ